MKKYLSVLAAIVTAVVMVLALSGPADAATKTRHDKRGDAPAAFDITKVRYRHNARQTNAVVRVRDLKRHGQYVLAIANRSKRVRFGVVATAHKHSVTKRYYRLKDGHLTRISCRGGHVTWRAKRDVVKLTIPHHCYRALPHRVLVKVAADRNFPATAVDNAPTVRF